MLVEFGVVIERIQYLSPKCLRDFGALLRVGTRIALIVAALAASAACVIGSTLGLLAGFYGGWVDAVVSRLIDVWMAFPPVLLSILLVAVLGAGLHSVVIAIAIIDWTRFARVIRADAAAQRAMDYVDAAHALGLTRWTALWREVLPNVAPTILVLFSLEMGIAVVVEAILSFVGLSVASDAPTWGGMIAEGRQSVHHAWWVLVFPLIALCCTVLAFNRFGDALRLVADPAMRR